MRFDLPADRTVGELVSIAATIVGMICKIRGADRIAPVVYTDCSVLGTRLPSTDFVAVLLEQAEVAGFEIVEALCVGADGWGDYLDIDAFPGPLDGIRESGALSSIPLESQVRTEALDGAPIIDAPLLTTERVARKLSALGARRDGVSPSVAITRLVLQLPALLEDALLGDAEDLDEDVCILLLFALGMPSLRDVAMLQWAFGREIGERALLAELNHSRLVRATDDHSHGRSAADCGGEDGGRGVDGGGDDDVDVDVDDYFRDTDQNDSMDPGFDDHIAGLMCGEGPQPDVDRVRRAIELLRRLVSLAPRSTRAPYFSMLSWLSWSLGQTTRAAYFIEEARGVSPSYGLVQLFTAMYDSGRLPEWAFDRETGGRDGYR